MHRARHDSVWEKNGRRPGLLRGTLKPERVWVWLGPLLDVRSRSGSNRRRGGARRNRLTLGFRLLRQGRTEERQRGAVKRARDVSEKGRALDLSFLGW
jgi:hypothetical protein